MYPNQTSAFLYTIRPYDNLWLVAQQCNTTVEAIASVNPGFDPWHTYVGQVICIYPGNKQAKAETGLNPAPVCISKAELDLNNMMRMLWEQHVAWTRMTIISMAENLPDTDLVTKRLLRNPSDFEAALKPYYGAEKASKFASLFTDHLVIAAQLVKAAKAGDSKAAVDAEKRWYANADEIASFLSSINPYWSKDGLKKMLYDHLAMTKAEAVYRLSKNYAADIAEFDKIEAQALTMADAFTSGIVKQFPEKF